MKDRHGFEQHKFNNDSDFIQMMQFVVSKEMFDLNSDGFFKDSRMQSAYDDFRQILWQQSINDMEYP